MSLLLVSKILKFKLKSKSPKKICYFTVPKETKKKLKTLFLVIVSSNI